MTRELGLLDQNGPVDEQTGQVLPATMIARRAEKLADDWRFIRFRGRCMVLEPEPEPHYVPLRKERFDQLVYETWGGLTRSHVNDVYAYVCARAPSLDDHAHLITFGSLKLPEGHDPFAEDKTGQPAYHAPLVWDMRALEWQTEISPLDTVWRSPYSPLGASMRFIGPRGEDETTHPRIPFILSLAGGDLGVYDDIMQSIAPIIMEQKPDGIVWWVGSGANGKSTLMDALYRVFPGQFASITVKRLVDGRDTPGLNAVLANVVKESSEGRVDDTEIYKSLGTHENFEVHKFHSQESLTINGNIHTIFSANSIPSFNDKGYSTRRRTFIVPFRQQFASDPDFEKKTFTPEFFSALVCEMGYYANRLRKQGLRYKWSAATTGAKQEYDMEASNAEEYARQLVAEGCVAFNSHNPVRVDYEIWCADNGYVPLGISNLRKALTSVGFERITSRQGNRFAKVYRLRTIDADAPLDLMAIGRPGLFTTTGFRPETSPAPDTPDTPGTAPSQQTDILKGEW